jgi:hypothetical protein
MDSCQQLGVELGERKMKENGNKMTKTLTIEEGQGRGVRWVEH